MRKGGFPIAYEQNSPLGSSAPSATLREYSMNIEFTTDRKQIEGIGKAQELLEGLRVEIGLTESASARNRWLLALHERGAPGAHIPPRPVVGPALANAETQSAIQDGLLAACEAAAVGDPDGVQAGFEQAGQAGVDGIHEYIESGIEPGNSPLTIHGGWIRNLVSKRPVRVEGKGFDKPMYRTGELYGAFSFTIKKRDQA